MNEKVTIEISVMSLVRVLLFALGLWLVYIIKDIIAIVIVAVLLASVLEPAVRWFSQRRIPKPASVIFMYLILLGLLGIFVSVLVPPILLQIQDIAVNFPQYWGQIQDVLPGGLSVSSDILGSFQSTILRWSTSAAQSSSSGIWTTVSSFFGGFISFFVVLVITYYFLVQEDPLRKVIKSVVPDQYQPYLVQLFIRMQQKIGLWLRGQLILSGIIFVITFITLSIIGVPYALVLSLLAGLFEMIPILGPVIASIPAIVIAFSQSAITALVVVIAYVVIQQVENHILVPKVMSRAVGLNPIVVILAVLVGAKLAGIVGVLLAVPALTAVSVFVKDFTTNNIKD